MRTPALLALVITSLIAPACKGTQQVSATNAAKHVDALVTLTGKDVDEVERGLPEGAKQLTALYAKGADPANDLDAVHNLLAKVRAKVTDLSNSKATFFALADLNGVGIRNDLDIDLMHGQDMGSAFPDIKKAASGDYVETIGAFPGSSTKAGADKDWVAAIGVKKDDGSPGGIFVTGWSYRLFGRHLYEALKSDIYAEAAANKTPDNIPVFYVAIFDKTGVYSAPGTPSVDEDTLKTMDLTTKTQNGPYQALVTITDRSFGLAAARAPRLGADTGIAVLRSEL
jgi:hypothetical protein